VAAFAGSVTSVAAKPSEAVPEMMASCWWLELSLYWTRK
jgi:hypothetical protein